jgi:DNA-binding transcriptional LysR family regulator
MGQIAESGKYFEPQIECQNIDACLRIVNGSEAIGVAPVSSLGPLLGKNGVVPVPFDAPWLRTNYGILRLRDRTLSPAAIAFCEEVRAAERVHHEVPRSLAKGATKKSRT